MFVFGKWIGLECWTLLESGLAWRPGHLGDNNQETMDETDETIDSPQLNDKAG